MSQPTEAQQALANETVRIMYSSFDYDSLAELIRIGEEHEAVNPRMEIVATNRALRAEVERRKVQATQ